MKEKGAPQDIEWCISRNVVYLLQARPITTLSDSPQKQSEEEHWTADNAQEAFPYVVSPFTMHFITGLLGGQFVVICKSVGVDISGVVIANFFDGYVYLNATALKKMLGDLFPAMDEEVLLKQILGGGEEGGFKLRLQPDLKLLRLFRVAFVVARDLITLPRRARQFLRRLWKKMIPPRHIYTVGDNIVRKVYEESKVTGKELKGVAASAGCVTARARVILDLSDSGKLQSGEILVTRFTDPAWTPLFSLAGGIVMDIGSMLSHGAVVARELGIPAVVGVRCATEVIEDGQEITVDGGRGIVNL